MAIPNEVLEAYGNKKLEEYTHWVYVLNCRHSYRTFSEVERKAEKRLNRKPEWLRESFEAKRLFYVGQTENLEKRLGEHFEEKRPTDFTTLYPPVDIHRLTPLHSRSSAEYEEHAQTKMWQNSDEKRFAYSR